MRTREEESEADDDATPREHRERPERPERPEKPTAGLMARASGEGNNARLAARATGDTTEKPESTGTGDAQRLWGDLGPDKLKCETGPLSPLPTERTVSWGLAGPVRDILAGGADALEMSPAFGSDAIAGGLDFVRNYFDMRVAFVRGGDKYFHCKANCEATQRGFGGEIAATVISYLREQSDLDRNVSEKGMTEAAARRDGACDDIANRVGRAGANTGVRCSDVCRQYRVRGL